MVMEVHDVTLRVNREGCYSPWAWDADQLATFAVEICPRFPVDMGIVRAVKVLRDAGVETFESCEGGEGHTYPEPTVRFHGPPGCGWKAVGELMVYEFPVRRLSHTWRFAKNRVGEGPDGPYWEVTFYRKLVA